MTSLESQLLANIAILLADDTISLDTELFSSGRLDSFATLALAEVIERDFGVRLEPKDICAEVLGSIASIAAWVMAQDSSGVSPDPE